MSNSRPLEQLIETWLEEGPSTAPRELVASAYVDIPVNHPQRHPRLSWRLPMLVKAVKFAAAAAAVAVVAVVATSVFLRSTTPSGGIGGIGGSASPSATVSAVPSPSATMPPSASPTAVPTLTPAPTIAFCSPAQLAGKVTQWTGAAGHRIANVSLTNVGTVPCETRALDRPQLVGPDGSVLIDGAAPAASTTLTVAPGGTLATMVQDGNYCGPTVTSGPVTVAFVLAGGTGRVVAAPLTATDMSGLPPCNSAPGTAGTIDMHPWAP